MAKQTLMFKKNAAGERVAIVSESARESVTRFVGTYINDEGQRTLMGPVQGRNTFATEAEAQTWLDAVSNVNGSETLRQVWGDNPRFEVRACPCYLNHFDPQTVWFD